MLRTLTRPLTECGMQQPNPRMAEFHSWITPSKTSQGSHSRASIQDRWCLCMKVWHWYFIFIFSLHKAEQLRGFFKQLTSLLYEPYCWFQWMLVLKYSYSSCGKPLLWFDSVNELSFSHLTTASLVFLYSCL